MNGPRHGRWACVLLSGLVYPGLGQLAQQRKAVALVIMPVFTVLICLSLYFIFYLLVWQVQLITGHRPEPAGAEQWRRALGSLGITLFVYALNVMDAWRHGKNP